MDGFGVGSWYNPNVRMARTPHEHPVCYYRNALCQCPELWLIPHASPPPPPNAPSRQTWWPTSRRASRRRVLPNLEGGIKILEVGTKKSPLCGVSCVVIIPFCMAFLNQCCTQIFGFWQLHRISLTRWAPHRLGRGSCSWMDSLYQTSVYLLHRSGVYRMRRCPDGHSSDSL